MRAGKAEATGDGKGQVSASMTWHCPTEERGRARKSAKSVSRSRSAKTQGKSPSPSWPSGVPSEATSKLSLSTSSQNPTRTSM